MKPKYLRFLKLEEMEKMREERKNVGVWLSKNIRNNKIIPLSVMEEAKLIGYLFLDQKLRLPKLNKQTNKKAPIGRRFSNGSSTPITSIKKAINEFNKQTITYQTNKAKAFLHDALK